MKSFGHHSKEDGLKLGTVSVESFKYHLIREHEGGGRRIGSSGLAVDEVVTLVSRHGYFDLESGDQSVLVPKLRTGDHPTIYEGDFSGYESPSVGFRRFTLKGLPFCICIHLCEINYITLHKYKLSKVPRISTTVFQERGRGWLGGERTKLWRPYQSKLVLLSHYQEVFPEVGVGCRWVDNLTNYQKLHQVVPDVNIRKIIRVKYSKYWYSDIL